MKKIILLLFILFTSLVTSAETKWTPIWKDINTNTEKSVVMGMRALDSLDFIIHLDYCGMVKIASSKDGANTWDIIYDETFHKGDPIKEYPYPQRAFSFAYPDKDHIFIAYQIEQIRHTRNRGLTFDTAYFPAGCALYNLVMKDTSIGIVYSGLYFKEDPDFYHQYFYHTTDGWKSYTTINIDSINGMPLNVNDIYVKSADVFSFISTRSDIGAFFYSTKDRGKTWDEFNLSSLINGVKNCYLSSLFFLNDSIGWISAMEPNNVGQQSIDVIFNTTNGGKTWKLNYKQENEPIFGLQDIAFHDENNGIAVGQWGKILRTTDGGMSWMREYAIDHSQIVGATGLRVCYMGSQPIIGTMGSINILWRIDKQSYINNNNSETNSMKIFPNPVKNNQKFNIEFNSKETMQNIIIKITDVSGKEFAKYELVQNSNNLLMQCKLPNDFNRGAYLVFIESEGEILATEKLILE